MLVETHFEILCVYCFMSFPNDNNPNPNFCSGVLCASQHDSGSGTDAAIAGAAKLILG